MDKETSFLLICIGMGSVVGAVFGGWFCGFVGLYRAGFTIILVLLATLVMSKIAMFL
jgi:hypothetical protein